MLIDSPKLGRFLVKEIVTDDNYEFRRTLEAMEIRSILDIGANVGVFSLMARMLCPTAKIAAVEPHPQTYHNLTRNLECYRVETYQVALGDRQAVDFSTSRNSGSVQTRPGTAVQSMGFLEILELTKTPTGEHTFIKVDCEGAEAWLMWNLMSPQIVAGLGGFAMEYHLRSDEFPLGPTEDELIAWAEKVRVAGVANDPPRCAHPFATTPCVKGMPRTGVFRTIP